MSRKCIEFKKPDWCTGDIGTIDLPDYDDLDEVIIDFFEDVYWSTTPCEPPMLSVPNCVSFDTRGYTLLTVNGRQYVSNTTGAYNCIVGHKQVLPINACEDFRVEVTDSGSVLVYPGSLVYISYDRVTRKTRTETVTWPNADPPEPLETEEETRRRVTSLCKQLERYDYDSVPWAPWVVPAIASASGPHELPPPLTQIPYDPQYPPILDTETGELIYPPEADPNPTFKLEYGKTLATGALDVGKNEDEKLVVELKDPEGDTNIVYWSPVEGDPRGAVYMVDEKDFNCNMTDGSFVIAVVLANGKKAQAVYQVYCGGPVTKIDFPVGPDYVSLTPASGSCPPHKYDVRRLASVNGNMVASGPILHQNVKAPTPTDLSTRPATIGILNETTDTVNGVEVTTPELVWSDAEAEMSAVVEVKWYELPGSYNSTTEEYSYVIASAFAYTNYASYSTSNDKCQLGIHPDACPVVLEGGAFKSSTTPSPLAMARIQDVDGVPTVIITPFPGGGGGGGGGGEGPCIPIELDIIGDSQAEGYAWNSIVIGGSFSEAGQSTLNPAV